MAQENSSSDSIIEVNNDLFLKKPLVAGDAWEFNPGSDYTAQITAMMNSPDVKVNSSNISVDSKKIVVGSEQIAILGGQHNAVRVDGVIDISITLSISDPTDANNTMTITEHVTGTAIIHLVKDTGTAVADEDVTIAETMKGVSDGESISLNENLTTAGTLTLVTFSTATAPQPKTKTAARKLPQTFVERCRAIAHDLAYLIK